MNKYRKHYIKVRFIEFFRAVIITLVCISLAFSNLFLKAEAQSNVTAPTVNMYTYCREQTTFAPTDPALIKIKEGLLKTPNFLQYTEYKMLKYKALKNKTIDPKCASYSTYSYNSDEYNLKPYGVSPLSKEKSFFEKYMFNTSGVGEGLDILTGNRAIDESLQLDSIGENRNLSDQKRTLAISSVTPLQIKSHPWETMLNGKTVEVPGIFSLAPKSYLAFYVRDLERFSDLEKITERGGSALGFLYNTSDGKGYKEQMLKNIGVKDNELARKAISEALFVWYDFDQRSEAALILKLKSDFLENFASQFVEAPSDRHGKIGDYYVISSSAALLKYIEDTNKNASNALSSAGDFKYVLATLEKDFDALFFISEAFIQNLTSPFYRLNARRRNTALSALETLQYVVFAYRDITGKWPASIKQIENEGYLKPNSVIDIENYSVDGDGVVRHKDWGTLYEPSLLRKVAIDKVTPAEKTLYDRFREGYESYWREYIDPVGISILVGDKIKLHTIILPLIDESDYNWLKASSGGEPKKFEFLTNPDRSSVVQFISKFNINDIIYEIYKYEGKHLDEGYSKCVDDYYDNYKASDRKPLSEICAYKEKSREDAIASTSQMIAKYLDMGDDKNIFSFLGDELTVFAGESISFNLNDFSKADVNLAIKLNDTEKAKSFIDHLYAFAAKMMGDFGGRSDMDVPLMGGFFKLDATSPLKNTYNGLEFNVVPLGFLNIYYAFLNDRFYLSISQSSMNKLADESKNEIVFENRLKRIIDYIGEKHNVLLVADGTKMETWKKGFISNEWRSYSAASSLEDNIAYYREAIILSKALPGSSDGLQNVSKYYRYIPKKWYDAEMFAKSGDPYIQIAGQEYNALNIENKKASYYNYDYFDEEHKTSSSSKISLKDITDKFDVDKAASVLNDFEDFGIGLSFTEDGLDIKAAINNPEKKDFDQRVLSLKPSGVDFDITKYISKYVSKETLIYGGGGLFGVIILSGVILLIRKKRRRKASDDDTPTPQPAKLSNMDNLSVPIPPRDSAEPQYPKFQTPFPQPPQPMSTLPGEPQKPPTSFVPLTPYSPTPSQPTSKPPPIPPSPPITPKPPPSSPSSQPPSST